LVSRPAPSEASWRGCACLALLLAVAVGLTLPPCPLLGRYLMIIEILVIGSPS
jgi:hypothetical protein